MKKVLLLLGIVVLVVAVLAYVGMYILRTSGVKQIPGTTSTEYRDEKYGYRLEYPNTWKTKKANAPGYVQILPPSGKDYFLVFWYKDSGVIKSTAELEAFVEDDAAYAESEQGTKTLNISPTQIGNQEGFAWDYQDSDGTVGRTYFTADLTPVDGQNIFVWVAVIINKSSSLDTALADPDVQSILASYSLLE